MLVNFYIDPDAVDDANRSHIRALQRKWRHLGIMTHPYQDDGGFRNIRRKFLQLDQDLQRMWALAWREIENDPTCYPRRRDDFSVALVSENRAKGRQIDNGDNAYFRSGVVGDVEWVRLTEINDSREFERAEKLATTPISANQSVQRLWQDRFQSLAKISHDIVVIDRYAAVESLNCVNAAHGIDCELFRLLDLIEQDSTKCKVLIYSSCDAKSRSNQAPPTLINLKASLESELRNRNYENIEAVTIYLPNDYHFRGNEARDRYIRFDCKVCSFGHPNDIFKGNNVSIGTNFLMNSNAETIDYVRRIENYLRNCTNPASNVVEVP